MGDPDCIFCKIVAGELPAQIVDEDERTIAFMDIAPATRGHALVIPREHARDLLDVPPEDLQATALAAQRLAQRASKRLGADGVGPQPAPLVPDWEPFSWQNGFVQIVFADVPCNWLQCQENSIDPLHFEWMHMNWSVRLGLDGKDSRTGPYSPRHLKLEFEEFDYGFVYRRLREGMAESDSMWTTGRVCLWPNALFPGDHFEWRVPVDDENTLSVTWSFTRVPREQEPYVQESIPAWHGPVKDQNGRLITSHVMNQDFVAWIGQGTIADRTQEHLGTGDRGVILLRKQLLDDLAAIEKGEDPKGVIRDPQVNVCVALPVAERRYLTGSLSREELLKHPLFGKQYQYQGEYPFQAGQPENVRMAYVKAMGIND